MPLATVLSPWLATHWFRLALLALGVVLVLLALWQRRRIALAYCLGGLGASLGLLALGGALFPALVGGFFDNVAGWLVAVAGCGVLLLALLLLFTGFWSRWLAFVLPAFLLVGIGGLLLGGSEYEAEQFGKTVTEMRIRSPWWLLLLAVVPVVLLLGVRRLNRYELRPWLAIYACIPDIGTRAISPAVPPYLAKQKPA